MKKFSGSFTNKFMFNSVPIQEKINFARHLHLIIKSGLPLVQGLELVGSQTPSRPMKKIIARLIDSVSEGKLLAEALKPYQQVFGDFFVQIIKVGEESGKLSENLLYVSDELRKKREIASKVKSAMVYPMIILIATIGIALFLVFSVLPKIIPILSDLGVDLPPTTKFLISFVRFSTSYSVFMLVGFVILVIAVRFIFRIKKVREIFHQAILFLPIVSKMVENANMIAFTRSLGLLLKSGITIVDALQISVNTLGNLFYRRKISRSIDFVKKGEQISGYLSRERRWFPAMAINLIKIGEDTGNLEGNLFYLSEYYEDELENSIKGLTSVMEPLLLLIMGLLVGFVAISIILPIYKISAPQI